MLSVDVWISQGAWRGPETTSREYVSPLTIWVLGFKLKFLGLAARALNHKHFIGLQNILVFQKFFLN